MGTPLEKATRRSAHRTQWAAQFAVASELCKRGYEVAFTMGNHPSVDLMVTSPIGVPFFIDVKGLYRRNFWAVKAKPIKADLFYVLAFVPDDANNRFFVMSQAEVNVEIGLEIEKATARALGKGRSPDKADAFTGVDWKAAEQHEKAWFKLPS